MAESGLTQRPAEPPIAGSNPALGLHRGWLSRPRLHKTWISTGTAILSTSKRSESIPLANNSNNSKGAAQQQQQQQGETSIDDSGGWDGGTILIGGDTFTNNQSVVVSNTVVNENTNTNTNENANTNVNDVDVNMGGGGTASGGDGGDGGVTTTAAGSGGTTTATDTATATTTTAATTTAPQDAQQLNFTVDPNTAFTESALYFTGADNGSNINQSTAGNYSKVVISNDPAGVDHSNATALSRQIFGVDRNGDDPGTEVDQSFDSSVGEVQTNRTTIFAQFVEDPVTGNLPNAAPNDELVAVLGGGNEEYEGDPNGDGQPDHVNTQPGEYTMVVELFDENRGAYVPPAADNFNITSGQPLFRRGFSR